MNKNHYLIKLSESERTQFGRVNFEIQSDEQRIFSAIWALESQVNNGGFTQYFDNEDSDIVLFSPIALRAIGAINCATIVDRALALKETRHLLETINKLASLDEEFFTYPDNLTDLLYAYIETRPTFSAMCQKEPNQNAARDATHP